jgi:hypothetical protein
MVRRKNCARSLASEVSTPVLYHHTARSEDLMMRLRILLLSVLVLTSSWARGDTVGAAADPSYTVEYYYRIKWGYKDEWMDLYKRSHWPIMVEEMRQGYVLEIKVSEPHQYMPDPYRWDLRVSVTYKNASIRYGDRNREKHLAQLFTDRVQQQRDENRRKELLDALWEVASKPVATSVWSSK